MDSVSINSTKKAICTYDSSQPIMYYTFFSDLGEKIGTAAGLTAKVYFFFRAHYNLIVQPVTRGGAKMLYARRLFDFTLLTDQLLTLDYNKIFKYMSVPSVSNFIETLVKNLFSYPISAPDFYQSLIRRAVHMMICTDIAKTQQLQN